MLALNSARRRILRAMLSAAAGGGLTAAGLGGPLASGALAAEAPAVPEGSSTTTATAPAQEAAGAAQPSTSTSTSAATTPTATTEAPATSTGPQAGATPPTHSEAPAVVVLQRRQKTTAAQPNPKVSATKAKQKSAKSSTNASGTNNVAASPQSIAESGALAALLASSNASAEALNFYRIPLFLLPIYKAAAVQYGVPWQILAAINEIETNYGSDLSVSTAGAVGWMQFMPSTWLQYGVDALNAGYADPYNPVDAIFAAARYLRAAGAATDLRAAILAYNHSEEYVDSVLLRAKLISTYPKAVIATLTGLIDGRLPVTGKHVAWGPSPTVSSSPSSATAGAASVPSQAAGGSGGASGTSSGASPSSTEAAGSSSPPSPSAVAAGASAKAASHRAQVLQLVDLTSAPNASVVAVQDGRIVQIGDSHPLGKYVILRDVYGDVFTYAGLGSIAPTYALSQAPSSPAQSPVVAAASTPAPAPSLPATAGTQSPLTLRVKTPSQPSAAAALGGGHASVAAGSQEEAPAGMGRVRLFAHPGNPDARAAAAAKARKSTAGGRLRLRSGSVVAAGTVLGRVSVTPGTPSGHLRFAIRPAGDPETVDPGPIMANWAQLQSALHPQGAKAASALLGATASDVFLLSKAQLERAVLSDPGVTLDACARREVASGAVDRRVLAVLAFLSRSGLEPTASGLRCGQTRHAGSGGQAAGGSGASVDVSAINGTAIAGHQGPGTITDLAIRTLLTLPAGFVPHEIISLMRYPGASNTHAESGSWNRIQLDFLAAPATAALSPAAAGTAHSARSGASAPSPLVATVGLNADQWNQLMTRVGALAEPTIATKPSSAAVPDPKRR